MKKLFVFLLVGIVLATILCFFVVSIAPDGQFSVEGVASGGVSRFIFRDGQVSLADSEAGTKKVGTYFRSGDQWIFVTDKGYTNHINATWLWLQVTDADGHNSKKYRRILFKK